MMEMYGIISCASSLSTGFHFDYDNMEYVVKLMTSIWYLVGFSWTKEKKKKVFQYVQSVGK